ncbi:MAG: beta-N-acetylhexosaminidase [Lachnospiraceae bacterium]|nr:beta-N-acetylhexosaminidase [Lachnospiraceae bacterium]
MYLLPQPKSISYDNGSENGQEAFCLRYDTPIVLDADMKVEGRLAYMYAGLLQQEIATDLGLKLMIKQQKDNSEQGVVFFTCCTQESDWQGYTLTVAHDRITIKGNGEAGLCYGVQTLRQIIRQCGYKLPCMVIEDAPRIAHRGVSYDVTRGRVPTLEHLKRLADTLSFYKCNQLQLYVEHSYLFEDFSEVWRDNTPLTAEEILTLDAYCKDLQIELVPSLASFGHLYEVLRTKSFCRLCELEEAEGETYSLVNRMGHHTVDVSNEESFRMVSDRIEEFMGLFSSRYFNICADETFDLCKGRSKALGEEKGVRKVYLDFLKKLCDFCAERGKIPMFWGDVLLEQPELLRDLPMEGVCLNWEYAPEVTEKQVKTLVDAGVRHLYLCPGVQSWNHMINRQGDAYENISKMCANAHKYHAEGVLNTEWGDLGHIAHPEFSTIGQIYGAAFSWSDKAMPEEEMNRAISLLQYGDAKEEIVEIFRALSETECVNWWHAVQYMEEQSGILQKAPEEMLQGILSDEAVAESGGAVLWDKLQRNVELIERLYSKLTDVSEQRRPDIYAYILMGQGQCYLTLTGYLLACRNRIVQDGATQFWQLMEHFAVGGTKLPQTITQAGWKLATLWEHWLVRYKELWRKESKEGELFRIAKVVCWYADRLREL